MTIGSVYLLVTLIAFVASFVVDRRTAGVAVAVALGLFAALLTAITLVLILTLDVESRWPTLNDVVEDSLLTRWFVLAIVAVVLAAFAKDSASTWLSTLALTLAIAGGFLGSVSLYHLLRISTGEGRQYFLSSLLAERIGELPRAMNPDWRGVGDAAELSQFESYFTRLERAIENRDVAAIGDRVSELAHVGESCSVQGVEALLALDLRVLRELGRAVVLARIDSPEIGSGLIPVLGSLIVSHSGRLLARAKEEDPGGRVAESEPELRAAAYLGQAARLLAWIAGSAYREALDGQQAPPALKAIASGSARARAMLVEAADPCAPDPLPATHPWHAGLCDPTAALIWWSCMCDLNGAHDGWAFYAVIAMLTGEKFFGSFGWGDRYLLGELEARLAEAEVSNVDGIRIRANSAVAPLGGVRGIALELLATSMSCWRDRRAPIPDGMEQNWTYWEDPLRLARRARLFLPGRDDPWVISGEDALEALARLISGGHRSMSLANLVKTHLGMLPTAMWPPVTEPQQRPAAAVLAVALHLAPHREHHSTTELKRFLEKLPIGLLEGALTHGEAILGVGEASRADWLSLSVTKRMIRLLAFIQRDPQAES